MHWVIATTPDDLPCWLNLSAVMSMLRVEDRGITLVFLGGVTTTYKDDGTATIHHANTQVRETPEQLMALPRQAPGAPSSAPIGEPASSAARARNLPPSIAAAVKGRQRKTA